jgi:DNA polymerase-3 subunit delta'
MAWLAKALPDCSEEERVELLTLAAGSPLAAVKLQGSRRVREQRTLVVEGVKKLLKQQQSPTQLAEEWKSIPLVAAVRLVLRLVEPDPALSADPG